MRSRRQTGQDRLEVLSRRRGTILVWFASFLFVLIPLMALIMHLGMVTLTRRQMQTAVNGAALEGLRLRDDGPPEWNDTPYIADLVDYCGEPPARDTPEYKEWLECARRWSTKRQISTVYNENLDSGDDNPVQLNMDDELYGDMVSGHYISDNEHLEDSFYDREDFEPGVTDDTFLVRLRRTDEDQEPNVSSSGPTIPFLFGRSANTRAEYERYALVTEPEALWDRRERGTIVRATSIAQAQPVITVGVPAPSDNLNEGLALFEIDLDSWEALANNSPASISLMEGMEVLITGGLTGRLIEREVTTLGDQTTGLEMTPADLEIGATRVVAITSTVDGHDHIVVGFGLAEMNGSPMSYTITRLPSAIVFRNAVASFGKPVSGPVPDFMDVWSEFQDFQNAPDPALALAPALVRSME